MDVQDLTTEQTSSATANMRDLSFKMDDAGSHTKDDSDVSHLDTPAQLTSDRILTKSQSDTTHSLAQLSTEEKEIRCLEIE
jgi:hypothetical protein